MNVSIYIVSGFWPFNWSIHCFFQSWDQSCLATSWRWRTTRFIVVMNSMCSFRVSRNYCPLQDVYVPLLMKAQVCFATMEPRRMKSGFLVIYVIPGIILDALCSQRISCLIFMTKQLSFVCSVVIHIIPIEHCKEVQGFFLKKLWKISVLTCFIKVWQKWLLRILYHLLDRYRVMERFLSQRISIQISERSDCPAEVNEKDRPLFRKLSLLQSRIRCFHLRLGLNWLLNRIVVNPKNRLLQNQTMGKETVSWGNFSISIHLLLSPSW